MKMKSSFLKDFGVYIFEVFFRLSNLKNDFFQTKFRVGYVYIEISFDTIFNMGYGSVNSAIG